MLLPGLPRRPSGLGSGVSIGCRTPRCVSANATFISIRAGRCARRNPWASRYASTAISSKIARSRLVRGNGSFVIALACGRDGEIGDKGRDAPGVRRRGRQIVPGPDRGCAGCHATAPREVIDLDAPGAVSRRSAPGISLILLAFELAVDQRPLLFNREREDYYPAVGISTPVGLPADRSGAAAGAGSRCSVASLAAPPDPVAHCCPDRNIRRPPGGPVPCSPAPSAVSGSASTTGRFGKKHTDRAVKRAGARKPGVPPRGPDFPSAGHSRRRRGGPAGRATPAPPRWSAS